MSYKQESLDIIVFEGRGAWSIYKDRDKHKIYIDSPLQNIIDAADIAKARLNMGKKVVMFPVIDRLIPTMIYNLPRTLRNDYENRESLEEKWKQIFPLILGVDERINSKEQKNVTHYFEVFKNLRKGALVGGLGEFLSEKADLDMGVFDLETTLFLLKKIIGKDENLYIHPIILPDNVWNKDLSLNFVEAILAPGNIINIIDHLSKFLKEMFDWKGGRKISLPFFFEHKEIINSSYYSFEIDKNNKVILLKSREDNENELELSIYSLKPFLERKSYVFPKYPLISLGYVYRILKYLSNAKFNEEDFLIEIYRNMSHINERKSYLEQLIKNFKLYNICDRFYFVEGDKGGINYGTGGLVDKIFKDLAEALGAEYYRIVSIEREVLEPKIEETSYENIHKILKDMENNNQRLYHEDNGSLVLKNIEQVTKK